jgi:leucyl aminopeptidase (aminopeptidase T)
MPAPGADGDVAKLITSVLTRSLRLRRGENVIIEVWSHAVPLAEEFVVQARRLGIRPMVIYEGERAFFDSQRLARTADAAAISAPELAALAAADGYVFLPGPADQRHAAELPAARKAALDRWLATWNHVLRDRSVRACYAYFAAPTEEAARHYEVDLGTWRREAREASEVDPAVFRRGARKLAARLRAGRRVSITHPNGTDLEVGLTGRTPWVEDGVVDEDDLRAGQNWTVMPAGLAIVPLDARTAEGRFRANRPSTHRRAINSDIVWSFRSGRLVSYESVDPTGVFAESYRTAGKERERTAMLSIGLNPKIHDLPLQNDQRRGTVTLYIGRNDDFGGRTRGAFRDYALLDGADVSVDGHAIVRAGTPV